VCDASQSRVLNGNTDITSLPRGRRCTCWSRSISLGIKTPTTPCYHVFYLNQFFRLLHCCNNPSNGCGQLCKNEIVQTCADVVVVWQNAPLDSATAAAVGASTAVTADFPLSVCTKHRLCQQHTFFSLAKMKLSLLLLSLLALVLQQLQCLVSFFFSV
jgi:hypothetical protein